jgi:transposase
MNTGVSNTLMIYCKAWPVRHRQGLFPKTAFTLDWEAQTLCCPHQVTLPFRPGHTVRFPAETCANCPLQNQCTTSDNGRSVYIHPDEAFLQELRESQATPQGRAKLRERVGVEHALAHIGAWQGERARYRTLRKNLFDLRRMAVVHNLHILARMPQQLSPATA